jgi:hypothetical protein
MAASEARQVHRWRSLAPLPSGEGLGVRVKSLLNPDVEDAKIGQLRS